MTAARRTPVERFRTDRRVRWSAYGAVPIVWLSIALATAGLMLLLPLLAVSLWICFRFGPVERAPDLTAEWTEL